jgi:TolB-like protein
VLKPGSQLGPFEVVSSLGAAILNEPPPALPNEVPAAVRAVIERCLAKAPEERFQSSEEVKAAPETAQSGGVFEFPALRPSDLRRRRWWLGAVVALVVGVVVLAALDVGGVRQLLLGGGDGQPLTVRMAVLPFINLTGDPEQEYLSDGITQEMITQLGRLHPQGLSVIARSSVMRYKSGDTPVDQIARELNVEYVLEGSARREANRLRITAQLVQAEDQTQLWADTYERQLSSILVVQSEVAQQVAEALALELDPFNALFQGLHSVVLYFDRRYDDALAAARTALTMQPDLRLTQNALRHIFFSMGMRDEQLAHQRERIAHDPELAAAFEQGLVEGAYEGAMRSIADVLAARYEEAGGAGDRRISRTYMPVAIARRYLYAGDDDRSIHWLEIAYQDRDPALPYLGLPVYDPLRSDPRFQDLLRRMNLPHG